jgi:glycerol-3-phosphate cytidylyltransferase
MLITIEQASKIAADFKKKKKKIVTTNGCFDIVHIGHVRYLTQAKKLGDVLIVGVNGNKSSYFKTKPGRPIINEKERAELVASLKPVDYVFIFDDETPNAWIEKIKPDFHIKAADKTYGIRQCVERFAVRKNGGKVVLLPKEAGKSTTYIIEKIVKVYGVNKNE